MRELKPDNLIFTAAICFYNAASELERCLESLDLGERHGINQAICIDGKYPNFEGKTKVSTDGSREIVKAFPNTILLNCADYEIHKRNYYLKAAAYTDPNTDYLFIIDSDEYLEPEDKDWKEFRKNICRLQLENPKREIWGVEIESNSDDYIETVDQILGKPYQQKKRHAWDIRTYQPKPRLWYQPWQFEYFLNHYTWRHKDVNYPDYLRESVFGVTMWDTIKGVRILHDHKLRSKEYLDKRLEYHRWLIQFEQTKVQHYFKHHNKRPLPHNLNIVEKWVDNDVLKRQKDAR